jgi:hypothetical protein
LIKYTIWDLDNCLADDSWRAPLIDWHLKGDARYARYNEHLMRDQPCHQEAFWLLKNAGYLPLVFTGRTETYRPSTLAWMEQHFGGCHDLYMRGVGDQSEAHLLKERMLRILFPLGNFRSIALAVDDLPEVVEMYRKHGIPSARLHIHEVDCYHPPPAAAL